MEPNKKYTPSALNEVWLTEIGLSSLCLQIKYRHKETNKTADKTVPKMADKGVQSVQNSVMPMVATKMAVVTKTDKLPAPTFVLEQNLPTVALIDSVDSVGLVDLESDQALSAGVQIAGAELVVLELNEQILKPERRIRTGNSIRKLFEAMLASIGLSIDQVQVRHLVESAEGNLMPTEDEIKAGFTKLINQWRQSSPKPKVILALGRAADVLVGPGQSIKQLREQDHQLKLNDHIVHIVPTCHPSLLISNNAEKPQVWRDLLKAWHYLHQNHT